MELNTNQLNLSTTPDVLNITNQELKEIINAFNQLNSIPENAINSAIGKQEEITPVLLEMLEYLCNNYKDINLRRKDYIIAIFLLAKFKEQKAFDNILKVFSLPVEWTELYFGDFIRENLASFITSTYNGNLDGIKTLIENKQANVWCRIGALCSLVYLFQMNKLSREDIIEYFKTIINSDNINEVGIASFIVYNACALYPEEISNDIIALYQRNLVETKLIPFEMFNGFLRLKKEECIDLFKEELKTRIEIDNIAKSIEWMYKFNKKPIESSGIKVGRNELCPCNSGKKYKKCCISQSNYVSQCSQTDCCK